MPQVSVIVPVYNVENYLKECLDSISVQTFKDIEIICVNDSSPDNSQLILEKYAEDDKRLKIINHTKNQGLGPARNTGVAHAISPYIAFVDSDDFISPHYIEKLFTAITQYNSDLAWCGNIFVNEENTYLGEERIPAGEYSISEILQSGAHYPSILPIWNKLYRKDLFSEIKQLPIVSEDQPALAEYFLKSSQVICIPECLYYYRKRDGISLSNPNTESTQKWEHFFYSHKLFFDILKQKHEYSHVLKKQAILRHFSILWRINAFNMLNWKNWGEQKDVILKNIGKDVMDLKSTSFFLYKIIYYVIKIDFPIKFKNNLIKIMSRTIRGRWLVNNNILSLPWYFIKTLKPNLIYLIKSIFKNLEIFTFKFLAILYKLFNRKDIWLISEREDTASDNGIYFFHYIKKNHPKLKSYYVINKPNSHKIKNDKIIFNTIKHKLLFLAVTYYISSHYDKCFPRTYFLNRKFDLPNNAKNVFLQHGITYADVSPFYGKKVSSISMFICGAKNEYEYVRKQFGYKNGEVALTGFARFDGLHDFKVKKQILLMPTWRKELHELEKSKSNNNSSIILNSDYYKRFQGFLNNTNLHDLLSAYNYDLLFYPHYEMQQHLSLFESSYNRIHVISKDEYEIQALLKESGLLITDSSSVGFDFAYMFKPIIYYFIDKSAFDKYHLRPGYFKHSEDGFGPLVEDEYLLIDSIERYLQNGCKMEDNFRKKSEQFFPLHDNKNCERIFNYIISN